VNQNGETDMDQVQKTLSRVSGHVLSHPILALATLITLIIAIGANSVIFGMADALLRGTSPLAGITRAEQISINYEAGRSSEPSIREAGLLATRGMIGARAEAMVCPKTHSAAGIPAVEQKGDCPVRQVPPSPAGQFAARGRAVAPPRSSGTSVEASSTAPVPMEVAITSNLNALLELVARNEPVVFTPHDLQSVASETVAQAAGWRASRAAQFHLHHPAPEPHEGGNTVAPPVAVKPAVAVPAAPAKPSARDCMKERSASVQRFIQRTVVKVRSSNSISVPQITGFFTKLAGR
jgi:hypothetical protein